MAWEGGKGERGRAGRGIPSSPPSSSYLSSPPRELRAKFLLKSCPPSPSFFHPLRSSPLLLFLSPHEFSHDSKEKAHNASDALKEGRKRKIRGEGIFIFTINIPHKFRILMGLACGFQRFYQGFRELCDTPGIP